MEICVKLFSFLCKISYFTEFTCLQDFKVDALEKFVEESSIPTVTIFNSDANNHPFVIKFFNSPNAKVNSKISSCLYLLFGFSIQ